MGLTDFLERRSIDMIEWTGESRDAVVAGRLMENLMVRKIGRPIRIGRSTISEVREA